MKPNLSGSENSLPTKLRYFGHASLMVTTALDIRVLMDPFQNPRNCKRWFSRKFPPIRANVVTVSRNHFGHNASNAIGGIPAVIRSEGSMRLMDLSVQAIADTDTEPVGTPKSNLNQIIAVETNGLRFCHMGGIQRLPSTSTLDRIRCADVLIVPIDDSEDRLSFEEVNFLIKQIDPKIIVPMHYFNKGLTMPEACLDGIDGWVESLTSVLSVRLIGASEVSISAYQLSNLSCREVWVLNPIPA